MKKYSALAFALLLFMTGCSAKASDAPRPTDGEGLYKLGCLSCHGENLEGAAGPPVLNMSKKYSEEEMLTLIKEGAGMMPGNLLSEEEAQTVTKWLMEK